jgi:hypothetical protein
MNGALETMMKSRLDLTRINVVSSEDNVESSDCDENSEISDCEESQEFSDWEDDSEVSDYEEEDAIDPSAKKYNPPIRFKVIIFIISFVAGYFNVCMQKVL